MVPLRSNGVARGATSIRRDSVRPSDLMMSPPARKLTASAHILSTNQEDSMRNQLILIRLASDPRIPRQAMGYIANLQSNPSPAVLADSLAQLSRYAPDLVAQFAPEQ